MTRPFLALSYVAFAACCAFLLAGIWTFTFEPAQGELLYYSKGMNRITGEGRNTRGETPPTRVEYSYQVEGETLEGKTIGMGFRPWTLSPFTQMRWKEGLRVGSSLTVYFSPRAPEFSVLHRGIDVVACFTTLVAGLALRRFSN